MQSPLILGLFYSHRDIIDSNATESFFSCCISGHRLERQSAKSEEKPPIATSLGTEFNRINE